MILRYACMYATLRFIFSDFTSIHLPVAAVLMASASDGNEQPKSAG